METYRLIFVGAIMTLCIVDLIMTAVYVFRYKQWQPDKPYRLIELNPILVFLWEKLGFVFGMIVGSVIIITLNYIIGKDAHWIICIILLGFLIFTIANHAKNFYLLNNLIQMYPSGHLPAKIFGNVTGNN